MPVVAFFVLGYNKQEPFPCPSLLCGKESLLVGNTPTTPSHPFGCMWVFPLPLLSVQNQEGN